MNVNSEMVKVKVMVKMFIVMMAEVIEIIVMKVIGRFLKGLG